MRLPLALAAALLLAPLAAGPAEDVAERVRALGSADVEERTEAYRWLLETGMKDPTGTVAALPAQSEDPEVQGQLDDLRRRIPSERLRLSMRGTVPKDLLPLLEDLFDAPGPEAVERLAKPLDERLGMRKATEILGALLAHPEPQVRIAAVARIAEWRQVPAARELTLPLLADADPEVRAAAANALGRLGLIQSSKEALLPLLEDRAAPVRIAAASSLGNFMYEGVAPAIEKLLGDPEPAVRAQAVLSRFCADPNGAGPKVAPLLRDPEAQVRKQAIHVLTRLKEESAADALCLIALEDPEIELRIQALAALRDLGDTTLLPKLEPLLSHPDHHVRIAALRLFVTVGGASSLPELRPLLSDPSLLVRSSVVIALAGLGDDESLPLLRGALQDEEQGVRLQAVRALVMRKDRAAAVPIARATLSLSHSPVRSQIIPELGLLVGERWNAQVPGLLGRIEAWIEAHKDDPEYNPEK